MTFTIVVLMAVLFGTFVPAASGQVYIPGAEQRAAENAWLAAHTAATTGYIGGLPVLPQAYPAVAYGGYGRPGGPGRAEGALLGASIGASVGGGFGGYHGMAIGAGSGAAIGYALGHRAEKGRKRSAEEIRREQEAMAEMQRQAEETRLAEAERRASEFWEIRNSTGQVVVITSGYAPLVGKIMQPGESLQAGVPQGPWRAVVMVPVRSGLTKVSAEIKSLGRWGWEVRLPNPEGS